MPMINIRQMGSIGVVSDVAPWDLPPAAFSDGMNFRLVSGKVQTAGGLESVSVNAGQELGHITQSTDLKGNSSWLACGERSILMFNGNDFYTLTGLAADRLKNQINVDPRGWSSAKIGNVSFFNNKELVPIYWADEGESTSPSELQFLPWHIGIDEETGDLAIETWADAGMSCNTIRSHKNFLFALGINSPQGQFNDRLHWSHPADPNGIPFSWRPTIEQPDSIAGALSLGRGGAIISGESLRDSFVVYSETGMSVLDFTGDALGWRRRAISETSGLANKEAVVEIKGAHVMFTGTDIVSFDGNSLQSLMHNRLRSRLAANVNMEKINNSWAVHYQAHNEVWFGVPEGTAENPNYAYCYNYRDDNWSIRNLEREIAHARAGKEPKAAYLTWEKSVTSWNEELGSWTQAGDRPFREVMYGLADQKINDLDPSMSTAGGGSADYSGESWDGICPEDARSRTASDQLESWVENVKIWSADTRKWSDQPEPELLVPDAPRNVTAVAGDASATVTWSAPLSDGGTPVTSYSVSPSQGAPMNSGDTSCLFEGLNNGTEYTFTVVANNIIGPSEPSAPSNAVTPEGGIVDPDPDPDPDPEEDSWIKASGNWDEREGSWISGTVEPSECSWVNIEGSWDDYSPLASYKRSDTYLQRTDLPIGGHEANTTITRVYPHVEGTATLQFRFGSQQFAGGPVTWVKGFRDFTPGKDRKIDVRTTGELHAFEVRSKEGAFKLTGIDFEYSPAGSR